MRLRPPPVLSAGCDDNGRRRCGLTNDIGFFAPIAMVLLMVAPRRWFNPCVRARGFLCLLRKSAVSLGQIHPSRPYRGAGFIPCSGADRRFQKSVLLNSVRQMRLIVRLFQRAHHGDWYGYADDPPNHGWYAYPYPDHGRDDAYPYPYPE